MVAAHQAEGLCFSVFRWNHYEGTGSSNDEGDLRDGAGPTQGGGASLHCKEYLARVEDVKYPHAIRCLYTNWVLFQQPQTHLFADSHWWKLIKNWKSTCWRLLMCENRFAICSSAHDEADESLIKSRIQLIASCLPSGSSYKAVKQVHVDQLTFWSPSHGLVPVKTDIN